MKKFIRPLADRVVIKPQEEKEVTDKGIYIPQIAIERPSGGVVMAVGQGTKDYKMNVAVGDEVIFDKNSGADIMYDGDSYIIMREFEIFAVV